MDKVEMNLKAALNDSSFNKYYKHIISPRVSEKASRIGEKFDQFVFNVSKKSTKPQIKSAIEHCFNVKVKAVNTVNVKGKTKFFAQRMGKRNDQKKAYVTLEPGYDIDFLQAHKQ